MVSRSCLGAFFCIAKFCGFLLYAATVPATAMAAGEGKAVEWYLTDTAGTHKLASMPTIAFSVPNSGEVSGRAVLEVDTSVTYQSIYGIGSSLESSTAYNLLKLSPSSRKEVLEKLFTSDKGIGFNLMRLTIGTADYCPAPFYSYDDNGGNSDILLHNFSTSQDEAFIVPAIQEAIVASLSQSTVPGNELRFFASPWSGPGWMKSSDSLSGGRLLREYHASYANYLAKFVSTYRDKYGIKISAITPQNEPLANQSYPSTLVTPEEENDLIRNHLGKAMQALGTEIWCFDHNWDTLFYPENILGDPETAVFVSGTGFHGYRGQPSAMTKLHDKFPEKGVFFTEGSMYKIRGAAEIVSIFRNWAKSYSAWITVLDTNLQPNSGPFHTQPTMIQIDADTLDVIYNLEYYVYGHFSKFLPRGSVRVASNVTTPATGDTSKLSHVAFVIPESQTISLILVNEDSSSISLDVSYLGAIATVDLPAKSVATLVWAQ